MLNELQIKLDAELAHTQKLCDEVVKTMNECLDKTRSIEKKLDKIIEENKSREEENKND
tara:strand:+ start:194 stop:370 length:177 start_codon:yes stop_codon:yes gene_type:complete